MLILKGRFSVVLPGCCEKSIAAKTPHLYLNYGEDTGEPEIIDNAKPEWRCPNLGYEWVMQLAGAGGYMVDYYKQDLSISFCPFCGQKLPNIVRVDRPELKVHTDLDGGYYCGTCEERNRECECLPGVVLFDAEQLTPGTE